MISQPENPTLENKNVNFEIIEKTELSDVEISEIIEINSRSFESDSLQLTFDSVKKFLIKANAYLLCLVGSDQRILGYASFLPEKEAKEYLDNREVFLDESDLYFSELAIDPNAKLGVKGFQDLFRKSILVSKEKGYKRLTMHARTINNLSNIIQYRYKANYVRSEENFFGSGEKFDYLFIDL
jgi:hypothetical protein